MLPPPSVGSLKSGAFFPSSTIAVVLFIVGRRGPPVATPDTVVPALVAGPHLTPLLIEPSIGRIRRSSDLATPRPQSAPGAPPGGPATFATACGVVVSVRSCPARPTPAARA